MNTETALSTTYLTRIAQLAADRRVGRRGDAQMTQVVIMALEIGYDIESIAWIIAASTDALHELLSRVQQDAEDVAADVTALVVIGEMQQRAREAATAPPAPATTAMEHWVDEVLANFLAPTVSPAASAASRRYTPPAIEPEAVTEILSYLRNPSTDPGVARAMLTNYRVPQLKIIAKAAHLGAMSGKRKQQIIDSIVWFTIELPRQHAAIISAPAGI